VRQAESMSRAVVITAHLAALPAAVVVSFPVTLLMPWQQPADIELHDTYFVVAHFHVTILLVLSALAVSLVAYRYGAINVPIAAAWVALLIHVASVALPRAGHLYVGSAVMTVVALVLGTIISLWAGMRRERLTRDA
jgi:hypothetical protein